MYVKTILHVQRLFAWGEPIIQRVLVHDILFLCTCDCRKSPIEATCYLDQLNSHLCLLCFCMSNMSSIEYTPSKQGRILQLGDLNYSYAQIAQIMGASKTGAHNTVVHNENHNTRNSLPQSGHSHAVNECNHHTVLQDICRHRGEPYKDIAEHVGGVTADQVQRTADDAGYHCRVAIQKPFLTKAAVKKQIKWAEENQTRNWDTVAWTDKSTIELGACPGRQFVAQLLGEEYLPECINQPFIVAENQS